MVFKAKMAAIEFAGNEVRVAVAKVGGTLPVVLEMISRHAIYEAPEERFEALVVALNDALDGLRHRPTGYVLCVNSLSGVVRAITIPFRGRRRVASAVRFELEPYLAFPIEDLMVDFDIIGEFSGETDVLAVGLRRDQLSEPLAVMQAAGIAADAVNLDVVGLTALWQGVTRKSKGLQAVLHARAENAMVVITYNGGLAYYRNLSCGAEAIRVNPGGMAREILNSLRAFLAKWRGEGEISSLDVTGVGFSADSLSVFSESMRMPVTERCLMDRLKGGAACTEVEGVGVDNRWEAMLGVAVCASGGPFDFNFLESETTWQSVAPRVIKHVMFSSCLGLLALLGLAFYYHQGGIQNEAETAAIQARITELGAEIDALGQKGLGADVDTQAFRDPTLLALLEELSKRLPSGKVNLTDIKISPPEVQSWWVRIQGTTSDAGVFNEVFSNFKASPMFRVEEDADLSLQGDLTTFAIKAFRKESMETEKPSGAEAAAASSAAAADGAAVPAAPAAPTEPPAPPTANVPSSDPAAATPAVPAVAPTAAPATSEAPAASAPSASSPAPKVAPPAFPKAPHPKVTPGMSAPVVAPRPKRAPKGE